MSMEAGILSLKSSTELISHIGQQVRARRKFLKISRKELSAKCGVSVSTILRLERNGVATLHVLVKVAIALNSVDTFENLFKSPKARSLDEYVRQIESGR